MIVLGDEDETRVTKLLKAVSELTIREGYKRCVIHAVSQSGRPAYLGRLRPLLSSTSLYTLVVRYEGSSIGDAVRAIEGLPDGVLVFVGNEELASKCKPGVKCVVLGDE